MSNINKLRFEILLNCVHEYPDSHYFLYSYRGGYIEALYDTDYESFNDLEMDDPNYEEFQSIVFERISDGTLFEVDYHKIPVKAICDDFVLYDEYHYPDINILNELKFKKKNKK